MTTRDTPEALQAQEASEAPPSLSDLQRAAVESVARATMVVAGPGSGKTRTLTEAVARAVRGSVPAGNCLVVTFTRMAAGEMRRRLEAGGIRGCTVGTFHSVCYYLIRNNWEWLGYSSEAIQVLDSAEQTALVKETIARSRHSPSLRAVLACLDHMARNDEPPEDASDAVQAIVAAYIRALKEANAVDYPLVPYLGVQVAKHWGPGWTHIFVDECQDLDFAQWRLFAHCDSERLFAVGDPDQLLYSWRGANVDLMRQQAVEWEAAIVKLEENYRCAGAIVDASNALIAHNKVRIEKVGIAVREDRGMIGTTTLGDMVAELADAEQTGTIAILGRTHRCLNPVLAALETAGLEPLVVGRRERILERDEVKAVLALLTLPDLPMASKLAERVWRFHGLNDVDIDRLTATCRRAHKSFLAATVERIPELGGMYADFAETALIQRLQWCISYARKRHAHVSPDEGGYLTKLIAQFVRQVPWASRTGDRFMAWVSLRDAQDEIEIDAWLQVMTIHASKGLEFDRVIVVGLDDWTLPIKAAHKDPERYEEERRLLFVAMTRAKDRLDLVVPHEHPSPFLTEIGDGI